MRSPADRPLRDVLLEAGAIRFKPILLTAAAMIGAAVILTDPIFQGLAISLLFGLASSTLLTVLVIPAIYVGTKLEGHTTSCRRGYVHSPWGHAHLRHRPLYGRNALDL
jgi:Cu/Ag efflux pump CusA